MKILVTGANGFVGVRLVTALQKKGFAVRAASRGELATAPAGVESVRIADIAESQDWSDALSGVDVVIHLAARVHVMHDTATDPLSEFRRVNVAGTINLGRQAARSRVRRFVFISSIKVNGESTPPGKPYTADDAPAPIDPYGVSKLEAEKALFEISRETGMEVTIIRPVMVYGPGVKGNFAAMIRWLRKGIPLPLGDISNRRSIVALDNLVDLLATVAVHPNAANEVFLVSDGEDLSTTELLERTAAAMGRRARLLPVPPFLLRLLAGLGGKGAMAQRLCDWLQVDIRKTRELLDWRPVVSVDEALTTAVNGGSGER